MEAFDTVIKAVSINISIGFDSLSTMVGLLLDGKRSSTPTRIPLIVFWRLFWIILWLQMYGPADTIFSAAFEPTVLAPVRWDPNTQLFPFVYDYNEVPPPMSP